jgi:hypothetical protein
VLARAATPIFERSRVRVGASASALGGSFDLEGPTRPLAIAVRVAATATFLVHLTLTRELRLAEYRASLFSRHQVSLWATNYPDEVPLINGEIEWIALGLADIE